MRKLFQTAMLALIGTAAFAETPRFSERQLAQQQRMVDCSAEAKKQTLRGDARMAFMKTCLSGGVVTVEIGEESATAPDRPRRPKPAAACEGEACERP